MNVNTGVTDPILVQVVKNGLESVAEQMSATLRRTAYSTLIREVLDYATGLFDRQGRLIAQSSRIPIFTNAMGPTLRFVLENCAPLDEWEPGDIFALNDPYLGGSQHLPDIVTFMPVFHRDRLVGIAGAIGHHVDLGGSQPGGYNLKARDIFQEGLRIPPVRLYRNDAVVKDIKQLIISNMRLPHLTWGDIEAQIAALSIGRRGLVELFDRFGQTLIQGCVSELLDYSERLMRQGIRRIPPGRYESADELDDDGVSDEPVRLKLALTVTDDEIVADFTGTDAQRPSPINGSKAMVTAAVHYAITAAVAPDVPVNEGCFRPIGLVAPEGTVVNALPPAPVVGRIAICHRCCDVLFRALAKAMPGRIPAAYYGMSNTYLLSGIADDGSTPWILHEINVGGWGGRPNSDGPEALSASIHNVANNPVEMVERLYPLRVERYALRADLGGAGRYRGGLGYEREVQLLEGRAALTIHSDRSSATPLGAWTAARQAPQRSGPCATRPAKRSGSPASNQALRCARAIGSSCARKAVVAMAIPACAIMPPCARTYGSARSRHVRPTICTGLRYPPSKSAPMLEVQNLSKRYDGLTAVDDCSFVVEPREIFGVIGPNGSGKTTLFQIVAGLIRPNSGDVRLRGASVLGTRPNRLARLGLAHTFQIPRVFGKLSVQDNVRLTTTLFPERKPKKPEHYLEYFGLAELADVHAADLSHGQQKLLEFATVNAMEPNIVLLDEPTAGVNPRLIGRIEQIIAGFRDEGRTVLIVEHTLRVVDNLCNRVLVLDQGRTVAEGTPAELKSREDVRRAYFLL